MNVFISIYSANESVQSASTLAVSLHLFSALFIQPYTTLCILPPSHSTFLRPLCLPVSLFFIVFNTKFYYRRDRLKKFKQEDVGEVEKSHRVFLPSSPTTTTSTQHCSIHISPFSFSPLSFWCLSGLMWREEEMQGVPKGQGCVFFHMSSFSQSLF